MMIVGLIVSIIQVATSITQQSMSFVPKLIALGVCLVVFGAAVVELLTKTPASLGYAPCAITPCPRLHRSPYIAHRPNSVATMMPAPSASRVNTVSAAI